MDLRPGEPVRLEMTKWGERPHWTFPTRYLGSDEHGDWLGLHTGTSMSRPGRTVVTRVDLVTLVPRATWWMATFYAPGLDLTTYVDVTTEARWDGSTCTAVDLDLDVVLPVEGAAYVDDEDEFAEHQVALGYPPDVVSRAETSCAWVLAAVQERRAPFDGPTSDHWLERLDRLARSGRLDG